MIVHVQRKEDMGDREHLIQGPDNDEWWVGNEYTTTRVNGSEGNT